MNEFTSWDIARNLLLGARWTVGLSLMAFVLGGAVGVLALFGRISPVTALRQFMKIYIEFFQDTPLLMQLFLTFFGLALLGCDISPWTAAAVALTLFTSAYLAEIWRGCVEAVPRGQWEAAESLALGRLQIMRHVVLPQAVRLAIPSTVGFAVQVVKGTAVTSIIGFVELTKTGVVLANATFKPFLVYGLVAAGYFLLCYPLSLCARHLERRLHAARSR